MSCPLNITGSTVWQAKLPEWPLPLIQAGLLQVDSRNWLVDGVLSLGALTAFLVAEGRAATDEEEQVFMAAEALSDDDLTIFASPLQHHISSRKKSDIF